MTAIRRFCACLLLVSFCLALPLNALGADTAVVNNPVPTDRLNLRASASKNGASLGRYYNGTPLDVLRTNGEWAYVRIGQVYGYMLTEFLLMGGREGSVPSAMPMGVVDNPKSLDRLNLRESPSENAKSLAKYANGTVVEIMGDADSWVHVRVGGNTGYMKREFLDITGGKTTSPQPTTKPPTTAGEGYAIVDNTSATQHLLLRDGPADSFKSVAKYENGTTVQILGSNGDWFRVKTSDNAGFMYAGFLRVDGIFPVLAPLSAAKPKGSSSVTLRDFPSENAHAVKTCRGEVSLQVLGIAGTWYYVKLDGENTYGYAPAGQLWVGSAGRAPAGDLVYGVVCNPNARDRLNVRATASSSGRIVVKLFNATQVEILDYYQPKYKGWYHIRTGPAEGYVQAQFIDLIHYGPISSW